MKELVDLRDERIFPVFANCPKREVDSRFYDELDDGVLKPKHHWCLLAEILDATKDGKYMKVTVKDKAGVVFPVFINHPDSLGWMRGFIDDHTIPQYKIQHSIAVLYPHQQDYRGKVVGVQVETQHWVLVIPHSMKECSALNDKIHKHHGGERLKCHACGKSEKPLLRCGKCNLFWYCDKACLLVDWKERGHKEACKILRNKNVQRVFQTDWSHYKSSLRFSKFSGVPKISNI